MAEHEANIRAQSVGYCWGPDKTGKRNLPQAASFGVTYTGDNLNVSCVNLRSDGRCGALGFPEPCVIFSGKTSETKKEINPIVQFETAVGDFVYDRGMSEVRTSPLLPAGHDPVILSRMEGILLDTLIANRGFPISNTELYYACYPEVRSRPIVSIDNTITSHVTTLRKKIGENKEKKQIIETKKGSGYIIRTPEQFSKK